MTARTPGRKAHPQDGQDGRGRIIREAARLFREKGFSRTTVRELAAATGMQSGSLFYFFASKEEILLAVIDHGIKDLQASVAEARLGVPPVEGFRAMVERHLEGILDRGADHMNVMLFETRSFPAATAEQVRLFLREYDELWKAQIEDLIRLGRWRQTADLRMSRMALMGALNWSVQWFRPGRGDTYEAVADLLCETFLTPDPVRSE
jgi:TetR/AcrR family transcriptional regulator, cholesterol catabolism regulator